jgi:type IV pilus assembly protein PilA
MPRAVRNLVSRRLAPGRSTGFTLVELAVVVTIVGVLAVIAVVGYRKLVLSAKVSEAKNMISAIRIAQEDYKVERGVYANIGPGFCPGTGDFVGKTGWDKTCSGGAATWATLPVHVDGPVQFGYATVAPPGVLPGGMAWVDTTKADFTKPWYVIMAQADLNGDVPSGGLRTELVGSSFDNNIFSHNEGE